MQVKKKYFACFQALASSCVGGGETTWFLSKNGVGVEVNSLGVPEKI